MSGSPTYLRPRVLDPLGITDLRWAQIRPGLDMGFSGVHTNLDAVARLGQLYLDDGVWEGRRILPEGWVADASSVQIANPQREEPDWRQGYGFQLWMSRHGYRGDGAFGQYMVVLPEHDAVVAMFSCTEHDAGRPRPDVGAPAAGDVGRRTSVAGRRRRAGPRGWTAWRCPPPPNVAAAGRRTCRRWRSRPRRTARPSHRTVTGIETHGAIGWSSTRATARSRCR